MGLTDLVPFRKPKVAYPPLARRKRSRVGEMVSTFSQFVQRPFSKKLWPSQVQYVGTKLVYHQTREIYRNTNKQTSLAGFGKRIVNSTPDFMELPYCSTGDEIVDEFVSNCIQGFWRTQLKAAIRDACRDGETIVRVRRHRLENPLVSPAEWEACYLEVVPPETVAIYYSVTGDTTEIDSAYVRFEVDEVIEPATSLGTSVIIQPRVRTHVIIEEITPTDFRYFDETMGEWRDDLAQPNSWGFVPLVQMVNEPDAVSRSGTSDLESSYPFMLAFHDVMSQALVAHKAHSIPKAVFKVNDMLSFIANNWPESFEQDEGGQPDVTKFSGSVSWQGTEILFLEPEEDVGFLEVKSALGDSETLLNFLLTCIAISSETPKSALMDQTAQDADEMGPLSKKINRKRTYFNDPITMLVKMVLAINHMEPVKVPLFWSEITPDIALKKSQTLQQDVMSLEVLATREVVSDRTMRQHFTPQIPEMKPNKQEAADATKNKQMPVTTPNSTSGAPTSTQSVKGTDAGKNA